MEKPAHIAIIMDGNGRWAKKRFLPRHAGHRKGAETLQKLIKKMDAVGGYDMITVYAFSTENWNRPQKEIDGLMNLLREYINQFIKDAPKENLKLFVIGDPSKLPADMVSDIQYMEEVTKDKTGLQVNIAINYGGRDDLVRMTKKILQAYQNGEINERQIDEDTINNYLDTKGMKDPDLLIRTSGEMRLSNFLLWQMAYTEFYFTDILWPDFSYDELIKAMLAYNNRQRRYGR